MNVHLDLATHTIPLWFLVLSLFLPRICIVVAWFQHSMPQFIPPVVGIIPVIVALLIPRLLILFWIYRTKASASGSSSTSSVCSSPGAEAAHRVYSRRRVTYVD